MKRKEKKAMLGAQQLKFAVNSVCDASLSQCITDDTNFYNGFVTGVETVRQFFNDSIAQSLAINFNVKGVDFDECNENND